MKIKELIKKLEGCAEFKDYKKERPDSFLAHIFKMFDEANQEDFQVGYYNKDDTITTFVVSGEDIQRASSEEIFKRPDAKVEKLDTAKVKIEIPEVIKKADEIQKKEFKDQIPMKKILILQKLDLGLVYNITFVTKSFNVLNFKISAANGKVLQKLLKPIMEFKAS